MRMINPSHIEEFYTPAGLDSVPKQIAALMCLKDMRGYLETAFGVRIKVPQGFEMLTATGAAKYLGINRSSPHVMTSRALITPCLEVAVGGSRNTKLFFKKDLDAYAANTYTPKMFRDDEKKEKEVICAFEA